MNGMFYKRGKWEEYLIRKGDDLWQYISKGFYGRDELNVFRPLAKIMRIIRDGRPGMPYTEEDKASFSILEEHFPWMHGFDLEVMGRMKVNMYALLIHAAKNGWTEVTDAILDSYQLREGELKHYRLDTTDRLPTDCLHLLQSCRKVYFGHRLPGRIDARSWYAYGEDLLHDYDARSSAGGDFLQEKRYYLSESVKKHLMRLIDDLDETVRKVREEAGDYLTAGFPQGTVSFRKSDRERKYSFQGLPYQFVLLRADSDEMELLNGDWEEFAGSFDYDTFCFGNMRALTKQELQKRCNVYAASLEMAAEKGGDRYAACSIRHLAGTDSEEDCEFLYRQDGIMRYVGTPVDLVPQSIELTESCFGIIKWSGKSRYDCGVKVDGKEYKTYWYPFRPELISVHEYHHVVNYHLTEEQQSYMWEALKADRESLPVGRPIGWKPDNARFYLRG